MHSGAWGCSGNRDWNEWFSASRGPAGASPACDSSDNDCLLSCSVIRREHGDPLIEELNPGDALEPEGRGTGEDT